MTYEAAPYTDAAVLISPTPAWRKPATWSIPDWFYVREPDQDVELLCKHARTTTLYGRSLTACSSSDIEALDAVYARVVRRQLRRQLIAKAAA